MSGIGVYNETRNTSIHGRCAKYTSICSAEILAISVAINTLPQDITKAIIISDSKSALQKIARLGSNRHSDKKVLKVRNTVTLLADKGIKLKFIWVPSHSNIKGNDLADRLAVEGRKSINEVNVDTHYSELYREIKEETWTQWVNIYKNMGINKGIAYCKLANVPQKVPWFSESLKANRKKYSMLSRMRTSHCLSPIHLHKIGIRENDLCECGQRGDLPHILFGCIDRQRESNILYSTLVNICKGPVNISHILAYPNSIEANLIVKFLVQNNINL